MTDGHGEISVLVADDHVLLTEVLQSYFREESDIAVDAADTLNAALDKIRGKAGYDVVLLDLQMPGMEGLSSVEKVVEANNGRSVILFSGEVPKVFVLEAIQLGAKGFISKSLPLRTLTNAIRHISAGEIYVPPAFLLDNSVEDAGLSSTLNRKELQVLRGLVAGKSNKEIGRDMELSDVTIKMHVRSICAKLNVKNRTQAAMIATQRRMV